MRYLLYMCMLCVFNSKYIQKVNSSYNIENVTLKFLYACKIYMFLKAKIDHGFKSS